MHRSTCPIYLGQACILNILLISRVRLCMLLFPIAVNDICICLNMNVPVLTCGASCQVACTRRMGLCSIHYSQQLLGCPKDCSAADGHRRPCTVTASSCYMALYTSLRYGVVVAFSNQSYICICIHALKCASELEQRMQTNMASVHAHVYFHRQHDMQAPLMSMQAGRWTLAFKISCQPLLGSVSLWSYCCATIVTCPAYMQVWATMVPHWQHRYLSGCSFSF